MCTHITALQQCVIHCSFCLRGVAQFGSKASNVANGARVPGGWLSGKAAVASTVWGA